MEKSISLFRHYCKYWTQLSSYLNYFPCHNIPPYISHSIILNKLEIFFLFWHTLLSRSPRLHIQSPLTQRKSNSTYPLQEWKWMKVSNELSNSFHPADIKGMGGHWKLWTITLTCIVQFKKYCQLFILIRFICERPRLTVADNNFNGTIFIADLEWTVMGHHKEMPNLLAFSLTNIPTSVIVLGKVCINFKIKPCFMLEMA